MNNWVKKELSFGNIIILISFTISIAINYTSAQGRIGAIETDIKNQVSIRDKKFLEIETIQKIFETDIRSLRDLSVARQEIIIGRLVRIETILERVEKNDKK